METLDHHPPFAPPEDPEVPLPLWGAGVPEGVAGGLGVCCRVLVRVEVDPARHEITPVVEHADGEFLKLFKHPALQSVQGRSCVQLLIGAATDAQALLRVLCPQAHAPGEPHHHHPHGEAAALLNLYDKGRHPISCRITSRVVDRQQPAAPGLGAAASSVVRGHHRLLFITPACFLAHCKSPAGSGGDSSSLLVRFHPALSGV